MDLIDAFALAVEGLVAGRSRLDVAELFHDARGHWAKDVVADDVRADRFDPSWLADPARVAVEIAAGLLGVDKAADAINPFLGVGRDENGLPPGVLRKLHERYWQTRRLSTSDERPVMPRPNLYREPRLDPAEQFRSLIPVPAAYARGVRVVACDDATAAIPKTGAEYATLPMMGPDGVEFRLQLRGGESWYAVVPNGGTLADRASAALTALDSSGAHIGVVPESTLDDRVLKAWQAAMRQSDPTAHLRLVLVGTGPVDGEPGTQAPNRAVMINRRNGMRVFDEDKRHGYAMEFDDLKPWAVGFDLDSLPGTVCHEWMREGSWLTIFEHPPVRLAVLVCEDLRLAHDKKEAMVAWGVTDLLVPVLAPPLEAALPTFGWQANAARDFARDVGCRTVVVNSRAHPHYATAPGASGATSFAYSPARTERRYSRPKPPVVWSSQSELDVVTFPAP